MQTIHVTDYTASRVSHRCISRSAPCLHPVVHRRCCAAAAGSAAEHQGPEASQQPSVQLSRRQWLQTAAAAALLVSATPYQAAAEADGVVSASSQPDVVYCTNVHDSRRHPSRSSCACMHAATSAGHLSWQCACSKALISGPPTALACLLPGLQATRTFLCAPPFALQLHVGPEQKYTTIMAAVAAAAPGATIAIDAGV